MYIFVDFDQSVHKRFQIFYPGHIFYPKFKKKKRLTELSKLMTETQTDSVCRLQKKQNNSRIFTYIQNEIQKNGSKYRLRRKISVPFVFTSAIFSTQAMDSWIMSYDNLDLSYSNGSGYNAESAHWIREERTFPLFKALLFDGGQSGAKITPQDKRH